MQGGCPGFESQWVHAGRRSQSASLKWETAQRFDPDRNRCTIPCKRGWEGSMHARPSPGVADEAVCTCSPGVHWTRSRVTMIRRTWLLCQLVDRSAREPMTDVPSCDKPAGPARRGRTQDLRMGIPTAIASRNGERRELKHLSTGRKRKQLRCR